MGQAKRLTGLLLVALLASCSSPAPEATVEELVRGGVFREALVRPASLEPSLARSVSERVIADHLYDGLSRWNSDSLDAEPSLAASWDVTEDNKRWTFVMRDDAKASNGEAITATDVKRSFEKLARSGPTSPSSDLLNGVVGYAEYVADPAVPEISGIAVTGNSVVISTLSPFASMPNLLGNPMFGIQHFNADGSTATSGPFAIESQSADNLAMVPSPEKKAYLDKVIGTYFNDTTAAYAAFDAGQADWSPVPFASVDAAGEKYGSTGFVPSLRTAYLSFNLSSPVLQDARYRKAIIHAIDRNSVAAKMSSSAEPLNALVPRAVPGAYLGRCGQTCAYDPERAKALVREVAPGGLTQPIDVVLSAEAPFNEEVRALISNNLAAAGIPANVVLVPNLGEVSADPNRTVFQTSWTGAYPAFDAFLNPLFLSTSPSNVTQLKDQAVDAALEAAQTRGALGRQESLQDAEIALLDKQVVAEPLAMFPINTVKQETVRGIRVLPTGNFDITGVWLSS